MCIIIKSDIHKYNLEQQTSYMHFGMFCKTLNYLDSIAPCNLLICKGFCQAGDGVAKCNHNGSQLSRLDTVQNAATKCVIRFLFLFSIVVMLLQLDCC